MAGTDMSATPLDQLVFPGVLGPKGFPDVRYELGENFSDGSFGTAWTILRLADKKVFVAKIVFLGKLNDKQRLRALSESSLIQKCAQHFGCVEFIEEARHEDRLLLVMEYCDAGDLAFQLKQRTVFTEAELKPTLLQLAITLSWLHEEHILHRDLKPENILLLTNGLVKIGDFGLSKEIDANLTQTANNMTCCGTPAYMAPEVWCQLPYGRRADIWSLGIVAYVLCTGCLPFAGDSWPALKKSIVRGEFPEPDPTLYSQELRDIIKQCLTVNPQERIDAESLLQTPYLQAALREFPAVLEATRSRIDTELFDKVTAGLGAINAKVQGGQPEIQPSPPAAMPTPSGPDPDPTLMEGPVGKFKEDRFTNRYLKLTPTDLWISAKKSSKNAPTSMPVKSITNVFPISSKSVVNGAEFVFAIQDTDMQSYWFQVDSEELRSRWITLLWSVMGAATNVAIDQSMA